MVSREVVAKLLVGTGMHGIEGSVDFIHLTVQECDTKTTHVYEITPVREGVKVGRPVVSRFCCVASAHIYAYTALADHYAGQADSFGFLIRQLPNTKRAKAD